MRGRGWWQSTWSLIVCIPNTHLCGGDPWHEQETREKEAAKTHQKKIDNSPGGFFRMFLRPPRPRLHSPGLNHKFSSVSLLSSACFPILYSALSWLTLFVANRQGAGDHATTILNNNNKNNTTPCNVFILKGGLFTIPFRKLNYICFRGHSTLLWSADRSSEFQDCFNSNLNVLF